MAYILLCSQFSAILAENLVYDQTSSHNLIIRQGIGNYQTFYSTYSKMFYVFFGDEYNGIAAYDYVMRYCKSFDGENWDEPTTLSTNEEIGSIEWYGVENQDFYLTSDGKQIYLVNLNDLDGRPYEVDYRVYNILYDGSLDLWIEEIDIAVPYYVATWTPENSISITVDNETRPYIAFENIDPTLTYNNMVLYRGAYTNGSWITWTSRARFLNDLTASAVDELFWCDLLNTGDGKTETGIGRGVNWIVHWDAAEGMGEALDTDSCINYYDGNGWSVSGLGGLGMEDAEATWERRDWSAVSVGNITLIVKMIEDLESPDRKRLDLAIREGKNAWQNRTAVSFTILGDVEGDGMMTSYVGIDNNTDFVIVWSVNEPDGNQSLWYRKGNAKQIMNNVSWEWQTDITEWQTVTATDGFNSYSYSSGGPNQMLPYNVPLSLSWIYSAADSIWHDHIFTEDNGELEYPATHTIDGDDFDWGSSWGDSAFWYTDNIWVFEGKTRYNFEIEYEHVDLGTVNQIGMRFTDEMGQTYVFWYDEDANTFSLTSPDDCLSGWIHSFNQVGTTVTVVFQLMFNSPIPDSYDIQLQMRVVSDEDTGWINSVGDLFNIYNLGGLATLYDTGMAGRITGGDIFEIYAADSRTNIEGSQYFDVREDPLSWYNVLTNEDGLINEMPPNWEFNLPRRTSSTTIRLTNNLPEDRTSPQTRTYDTPGNDDMAYVSYPFGMRLLSDPFLSGDYQIGAELTFPRELTSDDGTLYVQAYMMNPNTTYTTGAFRVRDGSRLDADTYILSDVQFNGNGSWVSYNRTASAWLYYSSYEAYTWYNVTVAINLTAANYDIFIDDVEVISNLPYRSASAETAYVVEFTQFVPSAGAPNDAFLDFYVDNVMHRTDFDADYGGTAEATMLFDKNQLWSMDFDFFVEDGSTYAQGETATPLRSSDDYSDHGYLEFGWDVMINKTLVHDFLVARVNISDGRISGKNNWVEFNIAWYEQGVYVKNDILYGLFEGYSIFPGGERDTTGFHWDIWFNRANASTIVGARINTEYYGLSDKSVWWAVWSSKWLPMRSEVSESTLFIDLRDADGVIHSANDVSFVRSWVKVYRTSDSQFAYKVLNIAGLDFLIAIDTMSGIDTPPIRETLVPDIPSGFFGSALGSIFSAALKRLGNTLAGFGMGFFTMSVDFLDNVFSALGYPALVSTIFTWMNSLFANVPTLLGYGLTLIDQIFRMINISATNTLTQLTSIITIWVGMYSTVMDLLTGALTPGINLWNDLGVDSFIRIGAILYPLWLLMMASEKGGQAVIDHLSGVLNIGSFFLNIILSVTDLFVKLLTGLIGAIRG